MRWKKITNFVLVIFFSIAYVIVTLFTFLGASHPPPISTPQAPSQAYTSHPLLSLTYLVLAMLISWGVYFYFRDKASLGSFLVTLLIGIGVISAGIALWVTTTY